MDRLTIRTVLALIAVVSPARAGTTGPDAPPAGGRVLWLRADRGVKRGISDLVSDWHDVSGTQVTLSDPYGSFMPEWRAAAINGRPALHFDGNDLLFGTGMPTGSYTKVAVCQLDDLAAVNNVFSSVSWHALWFGASDRARIFHGGDFVISGVPVAAGAPIVLVATYDAASGDGALWQDGALAGTGNDGGAGNWDASIALGSFGGGNFLEGSIAEIAAYDHVLNAAELTQLQTYLLERYHGDPAPRAAFDRLPQPGQILQRDDRDTAQVEVSGTLATAGYDGIELEITRDGAPFDDVRAPLTGAGTPQQFAFTRPLPAGRVDYEISVHALSGTTRRLLARVGNVAVGDVWLINGQSNAVAGDLYGEHLCNPENQGHWVRSFGSAATWGDVAYDLHWDVADGETFNWHATVGQWGLRLGHLLQGDYDVPIGLINGAVGGTSITLHQRNDADPEDLSTIYGRLLFRARAAGVATSARALVWYQGESDGNQGPLWRAGFRRLRRSWHQDFPALQKIDLFQIRDDCAGGGRPVREVQRRLGDVYPDLYVMSTTAVPGHDGCHYTWEGYRELGDRIERAVARDFYGSTDTKEIDPPAIDGAAWGDAAHTQILLTFRDPDDRLVFETGTAPTFFVDDGTPVVRGHVSGNTVLLELKWSSSATTVSYDGHPFDGPFLRNARGVGALTFFGVPIQ